MNELEVIEQKEVLGKQLRVFGTVENPLFLAKDVADWIEHSSITMMLKSIDEEEKVKIRPKQSLGVLTSNNEYWFLTEDGLYEVLMQSRKPIAKQFKKKVKEILKGLRLNKIEMVNKTDNIEVAYQIEDLINTVNTLVETVGALTEQNNQLMNHIINSLPMINNDTTEEIIIEDRIEEEILNLKCNLIKPQEFCSFINEKNIVCKKVGVQILYQLLRDNKVIDKYNIPFEDGLYVVLVDGRIMLNKKRYDFIL